jgi:hypothetical protein
MATFVNMHARAFIGHIDVTNADKVDFGTITVDAVPFTNFTSGGFTEMKPGLIRGNFQVDAFQDFAADTMDDELGVAALGTQYPISVAPMYDPLGGAKGQAAKAITGAVYDTAVIRGICAHPEAARTTTGNGTIVALTGPTTSQRLYCALHVTAYSGLTNLIVTVQSDDGAGFGSATTRATFATVTGVTSEFTSVAGYGATETHHRIVYTITGTGSVTFAAFLGVL